MVLDGHAEDLFCHASFTLSFVYVSYGETSKRFRRNALL